MWLEKQIEKSIVSYLKGIWAWCEWLQSWSITSKRWHKTYKINLCSNGTPDIICLYKGNFIAIEVKKNQEEVDSWIKKEGRYKETWELAKSNERELNQIKHKHNIIENGGTHIITCDINEVIDYFISL